MAFYIKQNDTSPNLRAILKDGDEVAINLTDATINFHITKGWICHLKA